jgi:hypothetical protein
MRCGATVSGMRAGRVPRSDDDAHAPQVLDAAGQTDEPLLITLAGGRRIATQQSASSDIWAGLP